MVEEAIRNSQEVNRERLCNPRKREQSVKQNERSVGGCGVPSSPHTDVYWGSGEERERRENVSTITGAENAVQLDGKR